MGGLITFDLCTQEVAIQAAKNAGIPNQNLFLLEGEMSGYTTVKELIEMGKKEAEQVPYFTIPKGKTNFDICGFLSFSSGTVSPPSVPYPAPTPRHWQSRTPSSITH